MSLRGIASGVAGSAAVALVATLSLGMTHASADPTQEPRQVHAQVSPPNDPSSAMILRRAHGPAAVKPAWLNRLLQRREPPMEAPPRHG